MSRKSLYFGNKERMSWVPCPAIDADISVVGWQTSGTYLNGGSYVRRSGTGAKRYSFVWNLASAEDIYGVLDYALGNYGPGPFFFLDPFAVDTNLMPHYWAAPRLGAVDAPTLVTDQRPTLINTAANTQGYPTKSAVYTLTAEDTFASMWVPVPDGYTFHFGAHGSATSTAKVTVAQDGGTTDAVTLLGTNTTQRTNYSANGVPGVTISVTGEGTLTLAGLIAQVLPTGTAVPSGGFISGRGHSGVEFESMPATNGYSSALDKLGASATLVETGAWL